MSFACLLATGGDENRHHMRTPATRLPEDVRARRKCHFAGCGVADLPPDTGSDENCHLVRARAIRLPECVVARRKCHAKKLAVGCQRCCNWLCYRHGDALAHQLVGTDCIDRQGRIIWMMKNAVQRHWTSFFCAGMWPSDKNCHATGWWARALRR